MDKRNVMWEWKPGKLLWIFFIPSIVLGDNLALLSGTLRTYQKAACDEEWVNLRCPTGTTISVQLAQYGRTSPAPSLCVSNPSIHPDLIDPNNNFTCHWPSSIQTVVGRCQKRQSCRFQTSPRTFGGDPCPSTRKFVEVAYKCRPSEFRSVIGCEDEVIHLSCNKSSRLAIYSANYGRTEYESVSCPQPTGVREETCLASYATETVMQLCHGKRRCALGADPATFGNPCRPESRMYLKVIHTCVPRKVLKEKYQGEPEPDEVYEEESDDETSSGGAVAGVLEQPSIYSPDHSVGWINTQTTGKPIVPPTSRSSEASGSREIQGDVGGNGNRFVKHSSMVNPSVASSNVGHNVSTSSSENGSSEHDVRIIYLISQGFHAYHFISKNSEKLYLYIAVSVAAALLFLLVLLLVKIGLQRRRTKRGPPSKPSTSSILGGGVTSSGFSDVDELSVVLDPAEYIDLPSILRRSPADELSGNPMTTSTLSRPSEVVRFSNSRTLRKQESDTNPRSFRDSADVHFYYG